VIDRLRAPARDEAAAGREPSKRRCASPEGRAIALELDSGGVDDAGRPLPPREQLFSNRFACPVVQATLERVEPRLISFNSPVRRDAHSMHEMASVSVTRVRPERVVALPHLEPGRQVR